MEKRNSLQFLSIFLFIVFYFYDSWRVPFYFGLFFFYCWAILFFFRFCALAKERSTRLKSLDRLTWWRMHQQKKSSDFLFKKQKSLFSFSFYRCIAMQYIKNRRKVVYSLRKLKYIKNKRKNIKKMIFISKYKKRTAEWGAQKTSVIKGQRVIHIR